MKDNAFIDLDSNKKTKKKNKKNANLSVSASIFLENFGSDSANYSNFMKDLFLFYDELSNKIEPFPYFDGWTNYFKKYYGEIPDSSLILNHVYLIILGKFILYLIIKDNEKSHSNEKSHVAEKLHQDEKSLVSHDLVFSKIIDHSYFREMGISDLIEQDPSLFLQDPILNEKSKTYCNNLIKRLEEFDLSNVDEDIFKGIYENIVNREDRVKTGEYYTPRWLVELIINQTLEIWEENNPEKTPTIIDPSCGSGSFIFHVIRKMLTRTTFEKILKNVVGYELNPLAAFITKVNYLLVGWPRSTTNPKKIIPKNFKIPVYTRDTLRPPENLNFKNKTEKFDIIIGNPPWIVMRSIKSKKYQNFLKKEVIKYKLLEKKDLNLFAQLEMSTLFFRKCADLYLKKNGVLSFVMPRSVIGGTLQHVNFRKFQHPTMKLKKILDLENVIPLFNMPSCVLISLNEGNDGQTKYPVVATKYSGELTQRNLNWSEINNDLKITNYSYYPPDLKGNRSYYYQDFKAGASIFPRAFYFVDLLDKYKNHNNKINNDSNFDVKTSEKIFRTSKEPWKLYFEGSIEKKFIYSTILPMDLIPFGCKKYRLIILPVIKKNGRHELLDLKKLKENHYAMAYNWLKFVEENWSEKRTEKSAIRFPSILDRLNYNNLLTIQLPDKKYTVIYNATGANIVSFVIDNTKNRSIMSNGKTINVNDIIIEVKTWFYETENEKEAHYLCSFFNSNFLNKKIKPLQPRGLGGARAIHRRPLLFPIPKFDEKNELHLNLADISLKCHKLMAKFLERIENSNGIKNQAKEKLKFEIDQIDSIVEKLIG